MAGHYFARRGSCAIPREERRRDRGALESKTPLASEGSQAAVAGNRWSLGVVAVHADEAFALEVEDDFLCGFFR
jgi:hypothetical protein